jgi:glycerol-3-phosphate acyltransferase PlsY
MLAVALVLVGYLLGSIPAGYIAGRIAGIDIRKEGSGNPGATNVVRVLGKRYGYPVFVVDVLKGLIPVILANTLIRNTGNIDGDLGAVLAGTAAVLGHTFPVWLRFKGGKGVATTVGVIAGLMPLAALGLLIIWVAVFFLTRYVSLASIVAAACLPLFVFAIDRIRHSGSQTLLVFTLVVAALVIIRHRSNMVKLWQGTEHRFARK